MKENKKIEKFLIKVSKLEKEEIRSRSTELGFNMSVYARKMLLGKRIIIKTDKEMIRQIKYVGNNINQIANQLNMRSDDLILADAYLQMEEYKQILQRILDNIEKK